MKSTILSDFLQKPKDKVFRIVGFETGCFFDREFSLNTQFEAYNDGNTSEVFNSLCEVVDELNRIRVGETMYHNCIRDDSESSRCIIIRIE